MPLIVDVIPAYLHKSHLTLLTGPPYVGKSRLLSWISHLLTTGGEGFWPKLSPLKVLFCTERTMELVETQFQGLQLPFKNPNLTFFTIGDKNLEWHREFRYNPLKEVGLVVKQVKPDIIILDTLGHFLSGSKAFNDYGSMADKIMTLQIFAYQHKCAVLAVHHTAKEKSDSFYAGKLDKTLGSQAIAGNTTAIWNLSRTSEEDQQPVYLTLHAESHATAAPPDIQLMVELDKPIQIVEAKTGLRESILLQTDEDIARKDLIEKIKAARPNSAKQNIYKAILELIKQGKLTMTADGIVSKVKVH